MILYDHSTGSWRLLAQVFGSVVPRCFLYAAVSAALAYYHSASRPEVEGQVRDPSAYEIYESVVAFTVVFRTSTSYNRFWEGRGALQAMLTKFTDAAMYLVMFDELTTHPSAVPNALDFQQRVAHLASLTHALLLQHLRDDSNLRHLVLDTSSSVLRKDIYRIDRPFSPRRVASSPRVRGEKSRERGNSVPSQTPRPGKLVRHATEARLVLDQMSSDWKSDLRSSFLSGGAAVRATTFKTNGLPVIGGVSQHEREVLGKHGVEERPFIAYVWWQRVMLARYKARGIPAPEPFISTVLEAVNDGMNNGAHCSQLSGTPFPFAYAQLVQLCLLIFILTSPIVVGKFMPTPAFAAGISFFATLMYYGLSEVGRELEDPFGLYPNNLEVVTMQEQFNERLSAVLTGPRDERSRGRPEPTFVLPP